jgi:hypothetical protein
VALPGGGEGGDGGGDFSAMSRLSVSFLPRSSILTVELLVASITPNRLMSNHFPLRPRRLIDLGVDAGRFGEALAI